MYSLIKEKIKYYNQFTPKLFIFKHNNKNVRFLEFIGFKFNSFSIAILNFFSNWILSTNHRRIALMYFIFTIISGFTGLILATIIRIELAYPGQSILVNNAEKYLTIISLHGIVMVFFMIIPIIFGAFGNFLLPTQLGIRDVAFPRLNSFMFWVTPSGFVMLLHIILFDKSYNLTYWLNYSELRFQLRRRFYVTKDEFRDFKNLSDNSLLAVRMKNFDQNFIDVRSKILNNSSNVLLETNLKLFNSNSSLSTLSRLFINNMYNLMIDLDIIFSYSLQLMVFNIIIAIDDFNDYIWILICDFYFALLNVQELILFYFLNIFQFPNIIMSDVTRNIFNNLVSFYFLYNFNSFYFFLLLYDLSYPVNFIFSILDLFYIIFSNLFYLLIDNNTNLFCNYSLLSLNYFNKNIDFLMNDLLGNNVEIVISNFAFEILALNLFYYINFLILFNFNFFSAIVSICSYVENCIFNLLYNLSIIISFFDIQLEFFFSLLIDHIFNFSHDFFYFNNSTFYDLLLFDNISVNSDLYLYLFFDLLDFNLFNKNFLKINFQNNNYINFLNSDNSDYFDDSNLNYVFFNFNNYEKINNFQTHLDEYWFSFNKFIYIFLYIISFDSLLIYFFSDIFYINIMSIIFNITDCVSLFLFNNLFNNMIFNIFFDILLLILTLTDIDFNFILSIFNNFNLFFFNFFNSYLFILLKLLTIFIMDIFYYDLYFFIFFINNFFVNINTLIFNSINVFWDLQLNNLTFVSFIFSVIDFFFLSLKIFFINNFYNFLLLCFDLKFSLLDLILEFFFYYEFSYIISTNISSSYLFFFLKNNSYSCDIYNYKNSLKLKTSIIHLINYFDETWVLHMLGLRFCKFSLINDIKLSIKINLVDVFNIDVTLNNLDNFSFSLNKIYFDINNINQITDAKLKTIQNNLLINEFFWKFDNVLLNFNKNAFISLKNFRLFLDQYVKILYNMDYFLDWRELRLERDIWRSSDDLSIARRHWQLRKKYYANFYEPESLISKVSIWLPNHLIPGWAFITPYSSRLRYTALGKVDIALVVVLAASVGSVFSSVNYVITYKYIGSPIFKNRKELRSFFVDGLLVGSRMMILANPALIIGIILLLSDRHFGTSVFDFSGGGDTILFQHLFWFFGHPEVYIIIIPCFGFMNSLLPYYLKKRLSGRLSLQFSMYTIAFMGFAVWGHHMYMVGLANSVRTLYSTMTVMISVPASTKVLHWCVTIINSTITCDVGFLFLLSFMYFFVLGGLSGMFVAHIGFDVIFHDTFFVIGHFHVMLAGAAMSCVFAAFYFYFPAIFGVKYSRFFAYLHFVFYLSGQLLTLIPMFWLGYAGMPRRIMDYPTVFSGWHSIISSGHILTFLGFIFFLFMIFDSIYENKAPISKTKGVSRLNNRFSLYIYESRKLRFNKNKNLLNQNSYIFYNKLNYNNLSKLELENFEYVFLK